MRVGVHLYRFDSVEPAALRQELADTARAAEDAGVAWVSVMDHYFQMMAAGFPADDPMLEAYTTLGYLAGVTSDVQLGVLVTGVTYRYPGLLAKIHATLDVLSGGRATLGIGAAWYEEEHRAMGVPYPPLAERFERLEETLQICRQMWSPNDGPFEGAHYSLAETISLPQPVHGSVPILIGGGGERKTLKFVAQYAQACNLFGAPGDGALATVAHKLEVLRGHCDELGTDYDAIEKTMLYQGDPTGDTDAFLADMERYAELGMTLVGVMPPRYVDPVPWTENLTTKVVGRLSAI